MRLQRAAGARILMEMAFDIEAARRYHQQRVKERRHLWAELEARARADAERIIAMLVERYKPTRIYQWGSLTRPDRFREWSDIDIALEGLQDPLAGLHAMDDAEEMTSFPVDLAELERIDPAHAETIRSRGRLVYERG